ncbi:MAG: 50S ribosomal protein L22 [Candidatus Bathyarchaeia archaeon]|nr:50S ribosomal protein L22 [Candidatus Bathyarchaeota archaeon]
MPKWSYSIQNLDPDKTVKCSGRELRISPKTATEVCRAIKGMKLNEAKAFLEEVKELKRAVPFRRYKKEVPHRRMNEKWYAGRYPVKVADKLLKLLNELEANAEYKGLNTENLIIIHAASQRGRKLKRYIPRAFGRATPKFETLTHIELVGYEASS